MGGVEDEWNIKGGLTEIMWQMVTPLVLHSRLFC